MGIFQGNSGTSPNASTFTSDIDSATRLATSAPFAAYLTEEIFQKSAFIQSGVVQLDSRLNNSTGTRVELPFFNSFSPTEEIVPEFIILKLFQGGEPLPTLIDCPAPPVEFIIVP